MGIRKERERKPKDKTREPIQHPNTMAPAMSVANKNFLGKRVVARQTRAARAAVARRNAKLVVKAGAYDEELIATANSMPPRDVVFSPWTSPTEPAASVLIASVLRTLRTTDVPTDSCWSPRQVSESTSLVLSCSRKPCTSRPRTESHSLTA